MDRLFLIIAFSVLMFNLNAQTIIASGECGIEGNNLTWILTDDSVLTISGKGAMRNQGIFPDNTQIKTVIIGDSVTTIGERFFQNCINIASVYIGNSVAAIGHLAFYNCTALQSITITKAITSIGNGVFADCSNLLSIDVDENNVMYSSIHGILYNKSQNTIVCCPMGKTDTIIIPNTVTVIGLQAFMDCIYLTTINIPNSVTVIGENAFLGCSNLSTINIPNSVIGIGEDAFSLCNSLSSIHVDTNNLAYSSVDGVLYSKLQDMLIFCPLGKTGSVIIPNSVITIGYSSFRWCYGITSITIGKSVALIESFAFYDCVNLDTIICKAVNPPNISYPYGTFYGLPNNVLIYIPCTGSLEAYKMTWGFTNYIAENKNPDTSVNMDIAELDNGFEITWQGNAEYYIVTRNWEPIDTVYTTSYIDTNLIDGNLCYRIISVNGDCESEYSERICKQYVGIAEQQTVNFRIFPNPAQSQFTVTNTENATIYLYNLLGQKVKQVTSTEENTVIQTEDLSVGMYVLKVEKGNGIFTKKVQVIR